MTEPTVKELEQQIADRKEADENKFKEGAWNLALAILDDLDVSTGYGGWRKDLIVSWGKFSASQRAQAMKGYLDKVYDKVQWALQDAIEAVEEATDADEGDDE